MTADDCWLHKTELKKKSLAYALSVISHLTVVYKQTYACQQHTCNERLVQFIRHLPSKFNDRRFSVEIDSISMYEPIKLTNKMAIRRSEFEYRRFLAELDEDRMTVIQFDRF